MIFDRFISALVLASAAGSAMAHGDHGFVPGLVHMFSGFEHWPFALATVASTVVAVRQAGAMRWIFGGLAAASGALMFAI